MMKYMAQCEQCKKMEETNGHRYPSNWLMLHIIMTKEYKYFCSEECTRVFLGGMPRVKMSDMFKRFFSSFRKS